MRYTVLREVRCKSVATAITVKVGSLTVYSQRSEQRISALTFSGIWKMHRQKVLWMYFRGSMVMRSFCSQRQKDAHFLLIYGENMPL